MRRFPLHLHVGLVLHLTCFMLCVGSLIMTHRITKVVDLKACMTVLSSASWTFIDLMFTIHKCLFCPRLRFGPQGIWTNKTYHKTVNDSNVLNTNKPFTCYVHLIYFLDKIWICCHVICTVFVYDNNIVPADLSNVWPMQCVHRYIGEFPQVLSHW